MRRRTPKEMTRVIAVYGALLSSVTFGWSVYRELSHGGKISLSFRGANERCIGWRLANVGDAPIAPRTLTASDTDGKEHVMWHYDGEPMPPSKELETTFCPPLQLRYPDFRTPDFSLRDGDLVDDVYVVDTEGQRWHGDRDSAAKFNEFWRREKRVGSPERGE